MNKKMIIDAYCRIRTIDQTIPDDVLDFMKDAAIEKLETINEKNPHNHIEEIKKGNHKQFIYNSEKSKVECRCGYNAIWWSSGYICGTITAYPCKYN